MQGAGERVDYFHPEGAITWVEDTEMAAHPEEKAAGVGGSEMGKRAHLRTPSQRSRKSPCLPLKKEWLKGYVFTVQKKYPGSVRKLTDEVLRVPKLCYS